MWYIVFSFIVLILLILAAYKIFDDYDRPIVIFGVLICGPLLLGMMAFPVLGFTTGLLLDYSDGERQGYITKLSRKGVIYKTWEAQIQVGTGNMAALQEPWRFSVPDELAGDVQALLGERVVVTYDQALILPYKYGETTYLATSVTPLQE